MILISPYSKVLRNGERNAKNFPYWSELLALLSGERIVQLGITGEKIMVPEFRDSLPLKNIKGLLEECDYWISVDNFLPHLAHHVGKPGVVIWSVSDPLIFGYPENVNVLKDRKYLRPGQFDIWEAAIYNQEAFPTAEEVMGQIRNKFMAVA